MIKLLLLLTWLLISCNDREVEFNDLGYSEQIFGVQFNPDQDWCTTVNSSILFGKGYEETFDKDSRW